MTLLNFKPALLIALLSLFVMSVFAQTTMMSSNPLKKNEVVLWNNYQYFQNTEKYDWNSEQWKSIDDSQVQTFHKVLPMIGYGITNKLSAYIQMPFSYFDLPNGNEFYFDDIVLMSRYVLTPSSGTKSGITAIGAVRLPTGKTGETNYSDGSFDLIIGEIFSTKWYNNWRTHVKSDFTITGKNINDENPGNEFNLFLKQDYKVENLTLILNNQFNHQFDKKDSDNTTVENTSKTRIIHKFIVDYKLKNGLQIRPGIDVISYAVGGSKYNAKLFFELIYKFPWGTGKEK